MFDIPDNVRNDHTRTPDDFTFVSPVWNERRQEICGRQIMPSNQIKYMLTITMAAR
jgi:hypothetical protein